MINPKNLTGYGEGWAFTGRNRGKNIDLSKFAFNEGYMQSIQHFGITDPLVCGLDMPYWYDYEENVIPVFKELGITEEEFISFMNDKVERDIDTIDEAISTAIDIDSERYIGDFAVSQGLKSKNCLFGITDDDYFTVLSKNLYENDEDYYDDIYNDRLQFYYY